MSFQHQEQTCHALGCEEIALPTNNLCNYHLNFAARDYKIYKLFQTKHQQMIDDSLSSEKLELLSIDTLIQYCIQLKKIITMRKEYTENYLKPDDCDAGHAKFLNFLEERIELCKQTIQHKYQSSTTESNTSETLKQTETDEPELTPTLTNNSRSKRRKKAKKSNPNALINQMAKERQQIISRTQMKLDLISKKLKEINPKITNTVISRLARFITYSIYNFSFDHDFKKCRTLKRVFCTCEADLDFYLQNPALLHVVTLVILNNADQMIPLIDLFLHSDKRDRCRISIFFMEKDAEREIISAIPFVSKNFKLEGCPTLDYRHGKYQFGVWSTGSDSEDFESSDKY